MSAPAESPTPAPETPAKPGRSVPLALLLAIVVGLAAGAGAGMFAVGPALAAGIAPAVQANARHKAAKGHAKEGDEAAEGDEHAEGDAAEGDEEHGDEEEGEEKEGGDHGKAAEAAVYTLDNLVLNPAESGGTRFLLLTISFQVKDAAAVEVLKGRDAELRDAVLVTVGNRTVEQLAAVGVRDSIKVELRAAAKKLFRKDMVKRVYFPQFVIQ